jgi:glutamate:GABA antiporter
MQIKAGSGGTLRRALGTFDLVLLNIVTIIGLRWLSTAAQIGPSSLTLWLLALLTFFLPSALAVLELSSRIPHEGGLYQWTTAALGDMHGFLAGWVFWLSNLVFFPSLLLFTTGVFLHVGGASWMRYADSPIYNGIGTIALLWAATILNLVGLSRAKWLQNLGGMATVAVAVLLLVGGGVAWHAYGSATPITAASLVPDYTSLPTLGALSILILAYDGLELGPVMAEEIRNPARVIPRAVFMAGTIIAVAYVAGTLALLVALPPAQINAISGIPEALHAIGARAGMPFFGALTAALLTIGSVGALGGWITGSARLPFVVGLGHYLPERFAAIHPKYGTPHVALLAQAAATTVVLVAALSGSAIHEAYLLLIDMTVALVCVVWLYIFISLPVLRRRAAGRNEGVTLVPGGPVVCWLVAGLGAAATVFAGVVCLIPPPDSPHPGLFLLKGIGGCVLILVAGIVLYAQGSKRRADARPLRTPPR